MKIEAKLDELDKVVKHINDSGIYLLQGDLASGKTSLAKAIVYEKIKKDASSPTFSVLNTYSDGLNNIYHYDIYQKGTKAFVENGLFENLFNDGLHLVEWADDDFINILKQFFLEYNIIKISSTKEGRLYEIN